MEDNIYNLIIIVMILFIPTISITDDIKEYYKLALVCCLGQKFLLVYKLEMCKVEPESIIEVSKSLKVVAVLEMEVKSPLIIYLSRLASGI